MVSNFRREKDAGAALRVHRPYRQHLLFAMWASRNCMAFRSCFACAYVGRHCNAAGALPKRGGTLREHLRSASGRRGESHSVKRAGDRRKRPPLTSAFLFWGSLKPRFLFWQDKREKAVSESVPFVATKEKRFQESAPFGAPKEKRRSKGARPLYALKS